MVMKMRNLEQIKKVIDQHREELESKFKVVDFHINLTKNLRLN